MLAGLCLTAFAVVQGPGWKIVSPDLGGETLRDVVWTGDRLLALGEDGAVLESPDGIAWRGRGRISGFNRQPRLDDLEWAGSVLVATGGDSAFFSRDTGRTWRPIKGPPEGFRTLMRRGTGFVGVSGQEIWVSSDGEDWVIQGNVPVPSTWMYGGMAWTGARFLLYRDSLAFQSVDGKHWTPAPLRPEAFGLQFAGGALFTECSGDCGEGLVSLDTGRTWRSMKGLHDGMEVVGHDGKRWVGFGSRGPTWGGTSIYSSANGVEWTLVQELEDDLTAIAWTGRNWVGVGWWGVIYSSPNAVTWTRRDAFLDPDPKHAAWMGGRYVLTGLHGFYVSDDSGSTWKRVPLDSATTRLARGTRHMAWNGERTVAVGAGGTILTSKDGLTWARKYSGTRKNLNSIAWAGRQWVAAGDTGVVLFSRDGESWTARNVGTRTDLNSVAWNGSVLAVMGGGFIEENTVMEEGYYMEEEDPRASAGVAVFASSDEGATWTKTSLGGAVYWCGGGVTTLGKDLAVLFQKPTGRPGGWRHTWLRVSRDGIHWETRGQVPDQADAFAFQGHAGEIFARSSQGAYSTADGKTWRREVEIGRPVDVRRFSVEGPRMLFLGSPSAIVVAPRERAP